MAVQALFGRRLPARATRRALSLAGVVVAALGGSATAAHAASISLAVSEDPAEDRATTISPSGVADTDAGVIVKIRPAGGAPCASTPTAEQGDGIFNTPVAAGSYSLSRTRTLTEPGSYLLCGYLNDADGPDAQTSLTFTVRSNIASIAFEAPPSLGSEEPGLISIRGATEVGRVVVANFKPAGGAGCGTSWRTDTGGEELVFGEPVSGAYLVQRTGRFETGDYLLCAWVQEDRSDLNPEAATSAIISVRPPDGDGDSVPDASDVCPLAAGLPPSGCPVSATKLEVARARVLRSARQFDLLAPISARASGTVQVSFQAAGRTSRFNATIDSAERRVLLRRSITQRQARLGTGIVTLAYPGDSDTQPQEVRLRAASQRANLDAGRPTISDGRLQASGEITRRARGVVRLQLLYEPTGAPTQTHEFSARIRNGRYSFDEPLPADVLAGIAQRRGTVHSYTLFTGYFPRRIRGEMESFQVMEAR